MVVYAIYVYEKKENKTTLLSRSENLYDFNILGRNSIRSFMKFGANELINRTEKGCPRTLIYKTFLLHSNITHSTRSNSVNGRKEYGSVIITDQDYNPRVAYKLVEESINMYITKYYENVGNGSNSSNVNDIDNIDDKDFNGKKIKKFPELDTLLIHYQDPSHIDKVIKVNNLLDENLVTIRETLGSLLERGEKIDTLVEKSDILNKSSKMFYYKAKKNNNCCWIQ